ncbi:MAG: type II toxin-antitoxin system YafQ family toxin [Melioribacteraceae bacterium]|nr:type II toxin-antitoxin system YafQ family toxin [Melioribacteraceae bacterium]MCF8353039.1 type II toxin-antitoxin system YafQ family toxin [Melioribacteraceae bacterium]MCF8392930.1 type II toxin-antitoxin system YafQ family toxin [Melioribacteraceae bacterium]MCF8417775.1 type II toxin-antitoxin system YafQ family toxin [Melioribacteraceae bacterium]
MRLIYSSQFKKDYKKIKLQGKDISQLETVVIALLNNESLPTKYKDHKLSGRWKSFRDCHIEPDWVLIYQITNNVLILERTGSHSELFK